MRTIVAALSLLVWAVTLPGMAGAAEAPIVISHRVMQPAKGDKLSTARYHLHVENRTAVTLTDVSLRTVRSYFLTGKMLTLDVGTLAAGQSTEISFELQVPSGIQEKTLSESPLFLVGRCRADGKALEFPARSSAGGAL